MTVAGAGRFQGIRLQSVYIKDQPSWPISVSNCIYETYDLGETLILGGGSMGARLPPAGCSHCMSQNRISIASRPQVLPSSATGGRRASFQAVHRNRVPSRLFLYSFGRFDFCDDRMVFANLTPLRIDNVLIPERSRQESAKHFFGFHWRTFPESLRNGPRSHQTRLDFVSSSG